MLKARTKRINIKGQLKKNKSFTGFAFIKKFITVFLLLMLFNNVLKIYETINRRSLGNSFINKENSFFILSRDIYPFLPNSLFLLIRAILFFYKTIRRLYRQMFLFCLSNHLTQLGSLQYSISVRLNAINTFVQ